MHLSPRRNEARVDTPVEKAKARARPVSEQLLGQTRPKGIYVDETGMFFPLR